MRGMRLRPWHALVVVAVAIAGLIVAEYYFEGGSRRSSYTRVSPGADGSIAVELADLKAGDVRFYQFLNAANQEVDFFVGRDKDGTVEVAYDASEVCAKRRRGFRHDGEWMVCNTCDKAFRLTEVNANPGGCAPVALKHRVEGSRLLLTQDDVLAGWRLFH